MAMKDHWKGVIILASLLGPLNGHAASPAKGADNIPEPLRVTGGAALVQTVNAAGVQVYLCSADKNDAARFEWQLKAPEADLFSPAGHQIGRASCRERV